MKALDVYKHNSSGHIHIYVAGKLYDMTKTTGRGRSKHHVDHSALRLLGNLANKGELVEDLCNLMQEAEAEVELVEPKPKTASGIMAEMSKEQATQKYIEEAKSLQELYEELLQLSYTKDKEGA